MGKDLNGKLKAFGDEVGANVWTKETDNIFTTMYDIPDSWPFERALKSVLDETVGKNQGKILFDINNVDISKAIQGGLIHDTDLVLRQRLVTELELQIILRNQSYLNNVIFHNNGQVLTPEEITSKGLKFISE